MSVQTEKLCLACTLCCNGALFADLKLSPADKARLQRKGFDLKLSRSAKLPQPCPALCAPHCTIYSSRPDHCRRFECLLLKEVIAGEIPESTAIRTIRTARRRHEKVRQLLQSLGDRNDSVAVSVRFRRLARSLETESMDAAKAALFGDLTLAMHDLNRCLARHFYPG